MQQWDIEAEIWIEFKSVTMLVYIISLASL